jgi:hypothetical protein
MKVTKMKHGYVVRCNDGDFAMLSMAMGTLDPKMLGGDAKAAHTRRSKGGGNILRIDEDRRK